jgi:hypothetical protein
MIRGGLLVPHGSGGVEQPAGSISGGGRGGRGEGARGHGDRRRLHRVRAVGGEHEDSRRRARGVGVAEDEGAVGVDRDVGLGRHGFLLEGGVVGCVLDRGWGNVFVVVVVVVGVREYVWRWRRKVMAGDAGL